MIDLNCDMGEMEDAALEEALMEFVTSASIACGAHAGNDAIIQRTALVAVRRGVRIGAHPSYPDRANFGRLEMAMDAKELEQSVVDQIRHLEGIAWTVMGGRVEYVKPHGALYNLAARDVGTAGPVGRAAARWRRGAVIFGLAGSPALGWWRAIGLQPIAEGFADRRYEADGSLRSRKLPGALILDPVEAAEQAVRLAQEKRVETICVHGDTPGAVRIARACRFALEAL